MMEIDDGQDAVLYDVSKLGSSILHKRIETVLTIHSPLSSLIKLRVEC
jgi:hypothetical protein